MAGGIKDIPSVKPTVLVVDDEDDLRSTAVAMFQSLGVEALDAQNGREALRILTFNPDVALLFADVRMPGISGVELARQAVALQPGLKVVLTSAYTEDESIFGFRLLRKPYRLSDLAALIPASAAALQTLSAGPDAAGSPPAAGESGGA